MKTTNSATGNKKVNSTQIAEGLRNYYQNYSHHLENSYIFDWESDFFCISKTNGYMYEVEIKISKSDFKADLKKFAKHRLFKDHKKTLITINTGFYENYPQKLITTPEGKQEWEPLVRKCSHITYVKPKDKIPNCLYYCCPKDLILPSEVPEYAGLLYYSSGHVYLVKKAPFLHKENHFKKKATTLLDKFYWATVNLKKEMRYFRRWDQYKEDRLNKAEVFLRRIGIDPYTGKKLNSKNPEINEAFYLEFAKFITESLNVPNITTHQLGKIIYQYTNPDPKLQQPFTIKKSKP